MKEYVFTKITAIVYRSVLGRSEGFFVVTLEFDMHRRSVEE